MKINGNSVRVGNVIDYQNKLWVVTKTQHTQPGKGGAYMQVEMKCMTDGTKMNERFRSSEQVERVHLENMPYQFLYQDGDHFIFMNQETFDQVTVSSDFLGDATMFLKDDMIVDLAFYEGQPITVNLPDTVVLQILEADPVVKGQTAASSYKPAILENGLRIMVPPHIESGMRVIVHTTEHTYIERAKD